MDSSTGGIAPLFPSLTDRDEHNYLRRLRSDAVVGYPFSANEGYYERVLRNKYPQAEKVTITTETFQVVQQGISAGPIPLTLEQQARQRLLRTLVQAQRRQSVEIPRITKQEWLAALARNGLHLDPDSRS